MRKSTGLSLLLLIFLSLCLILFSLLSLSGAKADQTLSQKTADRTKEYYAAVSKANEKLAMIDAELAEILIQASDAENPELHYLQKTSAALSLQQLEQVDSSMSYTYFPEFIFYIPVTENQELQISFRINYPKNPEDTLYELTGWAIRNTDTWTPDRSQNVYQP